MIIVARLIGKEDYGQFILVQSTLVMFGTFAGFGIGTTATRYIASLKNKDKKRLGEILLLCKRSVFAFGIIIAGAMIFTSSIIAEKFLNVKTLSLPIAFASVSIFFTALDGYQKSILIGFESMRTLAMASIAGAALGIPILFLGASKLGLDGLALGLSANAFIQAIISRAYSRRELMKNGIILKADNSLKEWLILRDFALPALLAGAMISPAHWVSQAMLTKTDDGLSQVAILGIAMQWFSAVLFLPMISGKVVAPILTQYVTENRPADSKRLLILAIKANAIIAVPVAVALVLLSPWILSFYGSDYSDANWTFRLVMVTAALLAIQAPVGNVVIATSKMWLGLIMNFAWAAIYIALSYKLIKYGSTGVATGLCVAYTVHASWTFVFAAKHIK